MGRLASQDAGRRPCHARHRAHREKSRPGGRLCIERRHGQLDTSQRAAGASRLLRRLQLPGENSDSRLLRAVRDVAGRSVAALGPDPRGAGFHQQILGLPYPVQRCGALAGIDPRVRRRRQPQFISAPDFATHYLRRDRKNAARRGNGAVGADRGRVRDSHRRGLQRGFDLDGRRSLPRLRHCPRSARRSPASASVVGIGRPARARAGAAHQGKRKDSGCARVRARGTVALEREAGAHRRGLAAALRER